MDGIGAAAAALALVVLLAGGLRAGVSAARRTSVRLNRAGSAAADRARAVGLRGLVAALAGTVTTGVGALASTAGAAAAPAPVAPAPGRTADHHTATATAMTRAAAEPRTYVVRPGDSLWAIAARHLSPGASDAAIAAEWPRWYRANRAVIGSNPSHLLVGTRLSVPHGRRTGTSASPHHSHLQSDSQRTALTLDPDRR
jgi:nucleoid-associated protein YgaU